MSESLKSWLFVHCATQATAGLEGNYDLSDMPYLPGNRIQILRFLTFRPATAPNSRHTDVWALVGDRTHCVAARFHRDQVHRFHSDYACTFTSLKGALVTLRHVRVGVARVQVHADGGPYRAGQYALMLDVKGWDVVSSVNEPVWYAGVKLVTSANRVPAGQGERFASMLRWLKKWVRFKNLLRRAREQQKRHHQTIDASPARKGELPTPAQRNMIALSSSQAQSTPPAPLDAKTTQEESFPLTTLSTQPVSPVLREDDGSAELWTDFDLDAPVDFGEQVDANQWGFIPPAPPAAPASSASAKSSSSTTTTTTHKQQRKRQRRRAALAALMAQIVD